MADSYTRVAKPVGTNYTTVNVYLPLYDESTVLFDDANTFYDGVDQNAYTKVPKPGGEFITKIGGITGLLIPLTYSTNQISNTDWTKVAKPT